MRKFFKKMGVIAIATMMMFSVIGCGGPTIQGNATEVQIYAWDSGIGKEYLEKIVADFNAKQSQYKAVLDTDQNATTIIASLGLGSSNKYDLYFTMLNSMQNKSDFITLDDVLDFIPDGETRTIKEKYNPQLLDGVKNSDGTTNFLTYTSGWCGIVYNAGIIDGVKYQVPVTTNELNYLTMDLNNDSSLGEKVKPWIFFSSEAAYWSYPMTAWQVQYDGIEYYNNKMMTLTDENGNSPAQSVLLKKDGRYEALKVASQIITPSTVHSEATNGNHTKIQTLFLQGEAVFMPSGNWLLNESANAGNIDVRMMKMPVISSIINVLPDKSVADDTELAAVVRAIDMGETKLRSDNFSYEVTQRDFDRIKEARNLMYNNGAENYVFIPSYSNAIDAAKEFLRYYYSDDGIATYMRYNGVPQSANLTDTTKFDSSSLNSWSQQQFKFSTELTAITGRLNKANLFLNTGFDSFIGLNYPGALCAQNIKDRKTIDQLWGELKAKVEENWEDWN